MKKLTVLSICAVFFMTGCITMHNSVPADKTAIDAIVKSSAEIGTSCKILGKTEATANVNVLFGLITWGDSNKVGAFPTSLSPFASPKQQAEMAASYKALDNYKDADRMLDPKWRTTVNDYFVFKTIESTVNGWAAQVTHK